MKIWVDDVRPAPEEYVWCISVNDTIQLIEKVEKISMNTINLIDLDHDAGEYAFDGGDYIKILDWLETTGRNYPIHIHSVNPVGIQNMKAIIERNGWKYYD